MKKNHILNPEIIKVIAQLGHTQYIVICDAGLPIEPDAKVIDLSLIKGKPSMIEVLEAVATELVIESYVVASEIKEENPDVLKEIKVVLKDLPWEMVNHEEFKKQSNDSYAIIRTGECSAYANIILVGGVNF